MIVADSLLFSNKINLKLMWIVSVRLIEIYTKEGYSEVATDFLPNTFFTNSLTIDPMGISVNSEMVYCSSVLIFLGLPRFAISTKKAVTISSPPAKNDIWSVF